MKAVTSLEPELPDERRLIEIVKVAVREVLREEAGDQQAEPEANLLSLREASSCLGISQRSLYRLVARGQLKPLSIGRRRLLPRVQIEQFVRQKARRAGR